MMGRQGSGSSVKLFGLPIVSYMKTQIVLPEPVWETHEAHKALVDSAGYADLFVELKGTMVGGFDMQHVPYDSDLLNILSAPVTEIFVLHLRPTAMKEELFPVLSRLAEEIDKEEDSFPPSVFGGSLDNGGIVIITVGWKSRAVRDLTSSRLS